MLPKDRKTSAGVAFRTLPSLLLAKQEEAKEEEVKEEPRSSVPKTYII